MDKSNDLQTYIDYLEECGKAQETRKQYTADLRSFLRWLDDTSSSMAMSINDYVKHMKKEGYQANTIKRHLSSVRGFLLFLGEQDPLSDLSNTLQASAPLNKQDIISEEEMTRLILSMEKRKTNFAEESLQDRNIAIVLFMRYQGFRPRNISAITMRQVNLAQGILEWEWSKGIMTYQLPQKQLYYLRQYLAAFDFYQRPTWKSTDPVFLAYNNRNNTYWYDYEQDQPKSLSARGIQYMLQQEVQAAGLRSLSAKHLRNSCILEKVASGSSDQDVLDYFQLTYKYSLDRYKTYLNESHGLK